MGKDNKIINKGANVAGGNGNLFQVEAAVYMFLENIGNCLYVSVEDADDIRITLKDTGEEIVAQAKSSLDERILEGHSGDIYKSFASFDRCKKSGVNASEYCCVFNYIFPFGKDKLSFFDYKAQSLTRSFSELPENVKQLLTDEHNKKTYSFEIEKTTYKYIWYENDKRTIKNVVTTNKIREFIEKTGIDNVNSTTLYQRLFSILSHNQGEKKSRVDGDILLGVIFDESSGSKQKMFSVFSLLFTQFGGIDSMAIKNEYNSLFGKNLRFDFFSKVNSFYFNYLKNNSRQISDEHYVNVSKLFYDEHKDDEDLKRIITPGENYDIRRELLVRMAAIQAMIHFDEIDKIEKVIEHEN